MERQLGDGIDFLGYIVRPTHRLVRRRVVSHAREKLRAWSRGRVTSWRVRATPAELREVQSIYTSYVGHFGHAAATRLLNRLHVEFTWLRAALLRRRFDYRAEGRSITIKRGRAVE